MWMKHKTVLFLVLVLLAYPCALVFAADSGIVITSYYPSPNVHVYDFFINTRTDATSNIAVKSNGDFSVGDASGPTIMTICDRASGTALCPAAGIRIKKDAYIDTVSVYGCNSGLCTGGVNVSNQLRVVNFGNPSNPAYIEIAGVPLKEVPDLYFPPFNDTNPGATSGYDYHAMSQSIANCYLGPPASLDACLAALNPLTVFRSTLSGACGPGECSAAKALYRTTKYPEIVAGIGVGVQLGSSHFGLGVAVLVGFGSSYTNQYAAFRYKIKD